MIRIVNLRNYKLNEGEVLIKVDRSSVLGNPFLMKGNSNSERDYVCDMYEFDYFKVIVSKNKNEYKRFGISDDKANQFLNELRRIYKIAKNKDVVLGCWCYPKRCHSESIKSFLEKYL